MLCLSRKTGEAVVMSNGVRVTVLEAKGDRIRLGFEAPTSVTIHRSEVWKRITEGEKH